MDERSRLKSDKIGLMRQASSSTSVPAVNNGTSNGATESFLSEVNVRERYKEWFSAVVADRGALIVLLVP